MDNTGENEEEEKVENAGTTEPERRKITHRNLVEVGSEMHRDLTCTHIIAEGTSIISRCGKKPVHVGSLCHLHWGVVIQQEIIKNQKRKG